MALNQFVRSALACFLLFPAMLSGCQGQQREINQAVFSAFRAYEAMCAAEQWPQETVRCVALLDKRLSCARAAFDCLAGDYYCTLYELGFDLPPFYLSAEPLRC